MLQNPSRIAYSIPPFPKSNPLPLERALEELNKMKDTFSECADSLILLSRLKQRVNGYIHNISENGIKVDRDESSKRNEEEKLLSQYEALRDAITQQISIKKIEKTESEIRRNIDVIIAEYKRVLSDPSRTSQACKRLIVMLLKKEEDFSQSQRNEIAELTELVYSIPPYRQPKENPVMPDSLTNLINKVKRGIEQHDMTIEESSLLMNTIGNMKRQWKSWDNQVEKTQMSTQYEMLIRDGVKKRAQVLNEVIKSGQYGERDPKKIKQILIDLKEKYSEIDFDE
jgi:primosomal protein N''